MHRVDLLQEITYIDGITIIDTSGTILFSVKFNPRFASGSEKTDEIVGENLFTSFPMLNEQTSTLYHALKTGRPTFRKRQEIIDFTGKKIETTNVTLPIKTNGRVIGAIELSKDISKRGEPVDELIELDASLFIPSKAEQANIQPEGARYTLDDIVTGNEQMLELKRQAKKMARGRSPLCLFGETGTGKELFAQALHHASGRSHKPFIAQNCAAIPESLMESILFGTKKGSFTGAEDNPGLFELADGGTIFLDEFNSMPHSLQAKLLRVLEDGLIRRLGDKHVRKVDVRVIAATNKHPRQCVKDGQLRPDLYYRLCVMALHLPPLRERPEDIELLLPYFINKYNHLMGKSVRHIAKGVYEYLQMHDWPGNIREFEYVVEFALQLKEDGDETLQRSDLEPIMNHLRDEQAPEQTAASEGKAWGATIGEDYGEVTGAGEGQEKQEAQEAQEAQEEQDELVPLKEAVASLETRLIRRALAKTGGNVSKAALLLNIPRQSLQNKIRDYEIK
ncbi:sigma-54 interaction domain-containing protein [Brevibacillus borstelensis]|uniref:sigma-54 interaction domain-containing protein n=1 Tax=Brevibacillus borstelensis TaxID=45462 RepID=UPI00148FA848|nr:sigma 54-interacting transcriptional regulator [Brevibacillus borstelensis]MCC0562824.1 sigma 54-interacting transcriptional regulator [Brevibacillus borstelensis]NOU55979.1 sigma 54-interacting transcriptional regulator [Brevibacillus borstelensis]